MAILNDIVVDEDVPIAVQHLSHGGLTHVSSKMIKYGDVLFEFGKLCGRKRFGLEVPNLAKTIVDKPELKVTFTSCLRSIEPVTTYSDDVCDALCTQISTKIVYSRVNETMKPQ